MIKTILLDIDGVLIMHTGKMHNQLLHPELIDGTLEKLNEWLAKGYHIILTTGRKEGNRKETEDMLRKFGISYDLLIMSLPRGPRVVINDTKPDFKEPTAVGIVVQRNEGIREINV